MHACLQLLRILFEHVHFDETGPHRTRQLSELLPQLSSLVRASDSAHTLLLNSCCHPVESVFVLEVAAVDVHSLDPVLIEQRYSGRPSLLAFFVQAVLGLHHD